MIPAAPPPATPLPTPAGPAGSDLRGWLLLAARILLGAVFFSAGVLKIAAPESFADSIASFRLLPAWLINPAALGLPWFEAMLGLWLASGRQRRPAAFCALVLTLIFLAALGSALARGINVDCGCFGSASDPLLGGGHAATALGRDLVLAAVAAVLYRSAAREDRSPPTGPAVPLPPTG